MESLAFLVVCIFVAVNLCGPGALILAYFKLDVLAVMTAAAALVLPPGCIDSGVLQA